jgi:hypothetical protein
MTTWKILGYAGLIPFVSCLALGSYFDNLVFESQQLFIAYSAIILSFIAGSLWRVNDKKHYKNRQVISNLFALIAFSALCIAPLLGLILLTTSFPLILFCEFKISGQSSAKQMYMIMRCKLTFLVFLMHIFAMYLWHFKNRIDVFI